MNLINRCPEYIALIPSLNGINVKSIPFDLIKRKYNFYLWQNKSPLIKKEHKGLAQVISLKLGKAKAGALLDGVEYKEFPNIMEVKKCF